MKKIINSIFIFVFIILSFSLISANGLNIVEETITLNKTYGDMSSFNITIKNEEPFKFHNLSIKEDFASIEKFDLESGKNKTVQVTIDKNEDFDGILTLIGEYETLIGSSNQTHQINIDHQDGFSRCDIEIIKGDSIFWINDFSNQIKLMNADSQEEIATIDANANYTRKFTAPTKINYYASYFGSGFTYVCEINVVNDQGLVHSNQYDDTINFNLKIDYDPTTISFNCPKKNYTISYDSSKEDICTIENTGTKVGKSIHLSGEWFSEITHNDFDLQPGESKNIGYKIEPNIFETNETNKTHEKILTIEGNFETITQNFSIYVPYEEIKVLYSDGSVDNEVLENFYKLWCKGNIKKCESLYCSLNPKSCENGVIVGSGGGKNYSMDEGALKRVIEGFATHSANVEDQNKIQAEIDLSQSNNISINSQMLNESLRNDIETNKKLEGLEDAIYFLIAFILIFLLGTIGFYIYRYQTRRNKLSGNFSSPFSK